MQHEWIARIEIERRLKHRRPSDLGGTVFVAWLGRQVYIRQA